MKGGLRFLVWWSEPERVCVCMCRGEEGEEKQKNNSPSRTFYGENKDVCFSCGLLILFPLAAPPCRCDADVSSRGGEEEDGAMGDNPRAGGPSR